MDRSEAAARQQLRQRKKRSRQSCYPCRTRKVKCDKCSPCDRCIKSGYPDLCTYDDRSATPIHRPAQQVPATPRNTSLRNPSDLHAHAGDEQPISASENLDRGPSVTWPVGTPGREDRNDDATDNGKSPYLGANAIPTLLRDHGSHEGTQQTVERAFIPMMGIDTTASAYPFSYPSTEGSQEELVQQLYQVLPAGRHIVYLFQRCKEAHAFSPVLTNISAFEKELCEFIESPVPVGSGPQPQTSVSWLSLLFAVLSYGEQFSEGELTHRRERSQLYARLAFQCLRIVNFLVRPTALCIQTLLVLGQVLQNDTHAELAWILLGTTVRMAQSIGLHRVKDAASSKQQLWSALVRQDSLLSSCYDRPPITMFPRSSTTSTVPTTYADRMNVLCGAMLDSATIGNTNTSEDMDFAEIKTSVQNIEDIRQSYSAEATRSDRFEDIRDRCEQHLLGLQSSFMVAWLCRPSLRRRPEAAGSPAVKQELRRICLDNLLECVKSFVKLNTLTTYAIRSWALVHNGLSSALLLGLLGDDYREAEARNWQSQILDVFAGDENGSQGIINLSAPHVRAIAELKKLNERNKTSGATQMPVSNGETNIEDAPADTSSDYFTNDGDTGLATSSSDLQLDGALQQQEQQQTDLSPLDLFDNILWDPMNPSQLGSAYDPTWFESTTF